MPFGFHGSPRTFQKTTDVTLSPLQLQFALIYLDDSIIFSRTPDEHIEHDCTVLSLLQRAGATLNLNECNFFTNKIDYLGNAVHRGRLELASHTTVSIHVLYSLGTAANLKEFLSLCNAYRCLVPNFARIATPFSAKPKRGNPNSSTLCRLMKSTP